MVFLLLACIACQSRKEPIARLQEQLSRDSVALSRIEREYPEGIKTNFDWCDSMLQYVPAEEVNGYFQTLNLAQAYLRQFNEMLPVMRHDLSYTRQQLVHLQNDLDTHYLNDSLAEIYLADETAVADTLHHRILYFEDRLSSQDRELKALRKTISKAVSR
ncbi:MAG: hypothetical protein K6F96_09150 [Bacteroidales bacterium]|nr:hypothetical protein [Bacteroidales bacterium]